MHFQKIVLSLFLALGIQVFLMGSLLQAGPVKGGILYLNISGEPTTINPITSTDLYARNVKAYTMESLLNRNDDTNEWEPALAESWEISKDGKTFTFKLRQGVTWHDGKPVTAEDVKFSLEVIFNDKYATAFMRPYYDKLEPRVEIVDPQTIKLFAKEKYFGNFMSAAELQVVPKHIYEDPNKGSKLNKVITGTGPYFLDSYERGKRIVLKRNEKWWGWTVPYYKDQYNFDRIIMRFIQDENVAVEMLKKGEIDFDEFTPEMFVTRAIGEGWGTKVLKVKAENLQPKGYGYIGWNFRKPMFQDKNVRIALTHLMNRKLMNDKFRYGMSLVATGPWYQQSEYASKKVKALDFNPKKAIGILKKAGWSDPEKKGVLQKTIDGKKTELRFTVITANKDFEKYLTIFKEDAKKAGVDVEIKVMEWNSLMKLLDEGKFDAANLGWGGGDVDLDPKQIWHSSSAVAGGSNFIAYKNPEVDALIEKGRETMEKKKRIPIFRKVYELIAADVPYTFLFNNRYVLYGHQSRIKKPKDTFKYGIGTNHWWTQE